VSTAREKIAWAADVPLPEALRFYPRVQAHVGVVKVGLSLFVEHGPKAVEAFLALGADVFLDLKLHDIPNTVELAAARAGALGVKLLTVHASGGRGMLEAALRGAAEGAKAVGKSAPRVLAVTALTSLSDEEVAELGFGSKAEAMALRLAQLAMKAGVGGLVCSAREAGALHASAPGLFLCTPGIRPVGSSQGDQARVETPAAAIHAGSSLLVVGRPLHTAASPEQAAEALHDEVETALSLAPR
jgi:orotidine-5'-phosphate decarboxylase